MQRTAQRRKPVLLQVVVTGALLCLLLAAYVLLLHATVGLSRKTTVTGVDHRDLVYVVIHLSILIAGALIGFGAGKWFSGLGFAFALLFVAVLAVGMVGIQLGSFGAACHGHNDIVRHWTC